MSDIIDAANNAAELFNRQALAGQLRKTAAKVSRRNCLDCEEPIPTERREKMPGCELCVDCKAKKEREEKQILKHRRTT